MSPLLLLTALNAFFGPACDVEYSLFPDNPAWFELDQTGIDDAEDMARAIEGWTDLLGPDLTHQAAKRAYVRPAPPSYGCRPTQTLPIVPDGTCI